jgi:nicotinamide-nucleotide amidase
MVDHLAETFVTMLARSGRTCATAESCTAGAIAHRLSRVPGASDVLRGGLVAYVPTVKFDLLSVTPGPVVTERAAREMAIGTRELFHAHVGLATTGVLGPATAEGQPVGTLWIGISTGTTWAQRHELPVTDGCCDADDAVTTALRVALQFVTNTALVTR